MGLTFYNRTIITITKLLYLVNTHSPNLDSSVRQIHLFSSLKATDPNKLDNPTPPSANAGYWRLQEPSFVLTKKIHFIMQQQSTQKVQEYSDCLRCGAQFTTDDDDLCPICRQYDEYEKLNHEH